MIPARALTAKAMGKSWQRAYRNAPVKSLLDSSPLTASQNPWCSVRVMISSWSSLDRSQK